MYTQVNENPNEGSSQSQRAKMVATMKAGGVVTSLVGLQQYGSLNVKGRMSEIKAGREVNLGDDVWIKTKNTKKHVKAYHDIDAINEKYHPANDEERARIVQKIAFDMLLPFGILPAL
ncbi:MAG: hypothetical protein IJR77_03685 [Bacteroidales bacterium]|nr:hypothetical protein [Bacteroidales bacterium]